MMKIRSFFKSAISSWLQLDCNETDIYDFALFCCPNYDNCTEAKTYCLNHLEMKDFILDENENPWIIECDDGESACYTADQICDVDLDCTDRSDEKDCGK